MYMALQCNNSERSKLKNPKPTNQHLKPLSSALAAVRRGEPLGWKPTEVSLRCASEVGAQEVHRCPAAPTVPVVDCLLPQRASSGF